MKSKITSRFALTLLALVLLLPIGGCAGGDAEPETETPAAASSSDTEILSEDFESGTTATFDSEVEVPEEEDGDEDG